MTELQFLLELLLNHKLTKDTKKLITERIGIVEEQYSKAPLQPQRPIAVRNTTLQAASTQAALDRHENGEVPISTPIVAQTTPPPAIAATALSRVIGGEKGYGGNAKGPRKF